MPAKLCNKIGMCTSHIVVDGNQIGMQMMKSSESAMHGIMAISELYPRELML